MQTKVRGIHERSYRAVLGIVDMELVGHIIMHVTVFVTNHTAQAREELARDRIYGEINE